MDTDAYLRRISYDGSLELTPEVLGALQYTHLLSVPFENLDIHLGREILLDENRLFDKIVTERRGGFCYELNGLFTALLQ
jgi:N-hydroxyarylamine O-acetyltransferase